MHNITDVSTFTDPIQVLDNGDPVDAAETQPTVQGLANRTRYNGDQMNVLRGMTLVASGSTGGLTILTFFSNDTQVLTGASAQIFQLPDETSLAVGRTFRFLNMSTGALTVKDSAGATLFVIQPHLGTNRAEYALVSSTSAGAATGNWRYHYDQPGQILGTQTNDTAAAGRVGEILAVSRVFASRLALTSGVAANAFSAALPLTAGAWRITACVGMSMQAGGTSGELAISKTSATIPTGTGTESVPTAGEVTIDISDDASGSVVKNHAIASYVAEFSTSTPLYLVALVAFTNPVNIWGSMYAERAR